MSALIYLHNNGPATLNQMAEVTGIPGGHLFAALQALVRAGNAAQTRGPRGARYEATVQGHQRVEMWETAVRSQPDAEYY